MAPTYETNIKQRRRTMSSTISALRTAAVLSALFVPEAASFGGAARPRRTALSVSTMSDAVETTNADAQLEGTEAPSKSRLPTPATSPIFVPDTVVSPITIDDDTAAPSPVDAAMLPTYDALARRCAERHARDLCGGALKNGQLFVGVGGGPGSGKSSLSEAVAARIDILMGRDGCAKVLPMDGFHYSRSELRSIAEGGDNNSNNDGPSYEDLLARRGAPWTFDAEGCVDAFTAAREEGSASLPVYSRAKSDPVPDGVVLDSSTCVVLLEGNYLLSWDDPKWAPLKECFDETWYVACGSMEEQRERLIGRHLETWTEEKTRMWGEGREGAAAKADANDVLNAEWIDVKSRHHADLIVESK